MYRDKDIQKFWLNVEQTDQCWTWKGRYSGPYGSMGISRRVDNHIWTRTERAHRFSYQLHYGLIPSPLVIDHLCKNTHCVRPDHLEAVLPIINIRRAVRANPEEVNKVCIRNHPWDDKNTRWARTSKGHPFRQCRTCDRERQRQRSSSKIK